MTKIDELRAYLEQNATRLNAEPKKLISFLSASWDIIQGSDSSGMAGHKLSRATEFRWTPPNLTFKIERHGAAARGSTRAEIQSWTVDLQKGVAHHVQTGFTQLRPTAPPLDVKPLAASVAKSIECFKEVGYLKWLESRVLVRVVVGKIIDGSGPKTTAAGRRQRFRKELSRILTSDGWEEIKTYTYRKA